MPDRLLTAEEMKLINLPDLTWPITWRFHVRAPWGSTQQELSVECPVFQDNLEASMALGLQVWIRGLAPASTHDLELLSWDTVCWRFAPAGLPQVAFGAHGLQPGPMAPRDHSGCLVMHTGYADRFSRRRLFFAGMPAAWQEDGLVTDQGLETMQTIARGIYIGLARQWTGGPMQWLLAYPEALPADAANPNGVAFRKVDWLRVCLQTEKAPLPSSMPWP